MIDIEDDVVCEGCGWVGYGGEMNEDECGCLARCPECGSEDVAAVDFEDEEE